MADKPTVEDLLQGLSWEELVADGIITLDEIEAMLLAKGLDPTVYDSRYE